VRLAVLTWNLKGSAGVDTAAVAAHARAVGADVLALQEVQWLQARRIARTLFARTRRWSFKHWPVRTWPEGMAVIGLTRPVRARGRALTYRWRLWSWRRRILVGGVVDGGPLLIDLHLSTDTAASGGRRRLEVAGALRDVVARGGQVIVAGDLNERPGGPVSQALAAAGLRDAWLASGGDPDGGFTNWRGWEPGTTRAPSQRIDYVWVSAGIAVVDVSLPSPGDPGFATFARLSDHLPLTVVLEIPEHG
jgi:endonuclease/exonuclease/phosphatase family metal-dependent hydrolase